MYEKPSVFQVEAEGFLAVMLSVFSESAFFNNFQAGKLFPFFFFQRIGDILCQLFIVGNRDIFQRVRPFLCLFNIGRQTVGGILHHGEVDGQFLHALKGQPRPVQRFSGAVVGVGEKRRDGIGFHQWNFRSHDTPGFDADGILHRNGIGDRLHIVDSHFHIGGLQFGVGLAKSAVDLGLNILGLIDQVHQLTDEDIPFFVHQVKALSGQRQGIFGENQVPLGGKCIWIHSNPPYCASAILSASFFAWAAGSIVVGL